MFPIELLDSPAAENILNKEIIEACEILKAEINRRAEKRPHNGVPF
jgi:hypothetical protein